MVTRKLVRRQDGLIEIRRRRAIDLVATPDSVVLLALLGAWALFTSGLVVSLVVAPVVLAMSAVFVALGIWGGRLARPRLAGISPGEPPPRRVA